MSNARVRNAAGALAAVALLSALPAMHVAAQTVDFSGQRAEIIVPFAPGGGSDLYARAIAPFLQKHLPGNPTIVIRNVPGGGALIGANQFEARSKPDGLHAIVSGVSNLSSPILQRSRVQYQIDKWEPVLLSPQGVVVYAAPLYSLGIFNASGDVIRDPNFPELP